MKMTLLQMTQNILSAMNSDEVNSIGDTTESLQVVTCIQTTYLNMLSKYDLPEHNSMFKLTASDVNQPVLMTRPAGISSVEWIKYWDSNPQDDTNSSTGFRHDLNTDILGNTVVVTPAYTLTLTPSLQPTLNGSFLLKAYTSLTGAGTPTVGDTITLADPTTQGKAVATVTAYDGSGHTIGFTVIKILGSCSPSANYTVSQGAPVAQPGYKPIKIVSLEEFLEHTKRFDITQSNVSQFTLKIANLITADNLDSVDNFTFTFNYETDKQPSMCCIINDNYFVFDSYDSTQDSFLTTDKTMCSGWTFPKWVSSDDYIPHIDENLFPLLLNDAKSLAFYELKSQPHQKAEMEVKQQRNIVQKFKNIAERPSAFDSLANFGRRGGGTGR